MELKDPNLKERFDLEIFDQPSYWIGLKRRTNSRPWYWSHSRSGLTPRERDWITLPTINNDDASELCAMLWMDPDEPRQGWFSSACNEKMYAICEYVP